ncbi:uncharacterized protein TNCV_830721 [Trichonephila clavipes]|nr:uncharacterized protein TNCV_830721 [Trichonephila clavipes]
MLQDYYDNCHESVLNASLISVPCIRNRGVGWKSRATVVTFLLEKMGGRGSLVVKVSDRGWHVTSSSPVPLKTRRVGARCTLNLLRAQTSSRWCGVVVRRGVCQLRYRPRHLTMVQNYEVRHQKSECS